VSPKYHRRERA